MAISDVQEIKAYIVEDNPGAATKMGTAIYSKIEKLADFPEMGASHYLSILIADELPKD